MRKGDNQKKESENKRQEEQEHQRGAWGEGSGKRERS